MALKKIDNVGLLQKNGVDRFGQPLFGFTLIVQARYNKEEKLVTDDKGEEFVSHHSVYFDDTVNISVGDKVKDWDNNGPWFFVRSVVRYRNGTGTKSFNIAYCSGNLG